MELNAEQIKKALECCTGYDDCNRCPYWVDVDVNCFDNVKSDALALINSQEQRIGELTEENESLKQAMEHEHASFMETFGEYGEKCERLTEENERLSTALANYDRQTELRIAEEYYTAEAYEELREENERLKAICGMKECVIENAEAVIARTKADTVQEYREGLHKEFASLGAKDKFNKEFFLTKADQIAKEVTEGE